MTDEDVSGAMERVEADGFDLSSGVWETEIEWKNSGMILSVSAEGSCPADGRGSLAELDRSDAVKILWDNMPAEEKVWKSAQWGADAPEDMQMAGPVYFTRYTGKWQGCKVKIEVWEIPDRGDQASGENQYLTEISFNAKNYEEAASVREKLRDSLNEQGILLEQDVLKTDRILDVYFGMAE